MKLRLNFRRQDYRYLPYWGATPLRARIIIVGLGGTGGYVFYYLSRLVAALKEVPDEDKGTDFQIVLVDPDIVEGKNTVRQNFIAQDIGKFKVEVLSERYGNIYRMNIPYRAEEINNADHLVNLLTSKIAGFRPTIGCLLGCVDNNATRQIFHEAFKNCPDPLVYIDSGNDEWAGQVFLGCKGRGNNTIIEPVGCYFPDILEDEDTKLPSELSCQEQAVSSPQNITTNITAATAMFNLFNQLFIEKGIETRGITFDARTGDCRALWIEPEDIRAPREEQYLFPFELV